MVPRSLWDALEALGSVGGSAFEQLFDGAPVGIYIDDQQQGCVYANQTLLDTWGMNWEEFQGFGWAARIVPEDLGRVQEEVRRHEHDHTTFDCHYRILRKSDDQLAWIRAHVKAVVDADGRHAGSVGVVWDQTASRNMADHFARKQALEAVGSVAGRVAHDFNNLLCVVSGTLDLMARAEASKQGELRSVARQTVEHGAQITQQLLALAGQQNRGLPQCTLDASLLALMPLVERLVGEGVQLECALGAGQRVVGMSSSQLGQVVVNLVTNATDAMAGRGRILLTTEPLGESDVLMRVQDDGPGMDEATVARVCEPFFTTKEVGRGTGLGLAIVSDMVELARGTLSFESRPGMGTTVRLRLPVLTTRPETLGVSTVSAPRRGEGESVLLVEDNDALRHTLGIGLSMSGYRISAARDIAGAWELVEQQPPAVLVTDILLPDGDGRELAEQLRKRDPKLPVLFMTGFAGAHPISHDGSANVALLTKPFPLDALHQRVAQLLEAKHRERGE